MLLVWGQSITKEPNIEFSRLLCISIFHSYVLLIVLYMRIAENHVKLKIAKRIKENKE